MYKTLRSLKVERNGKIVMLPPGAEIPEAATFRNVKSWINRGWITDEDGSISAQHRHAAAKVSVSVAKAAPKAEPTPEPVAKEAEPKEIDPEDLASALAEMSKRELNTFAKEQELNPKDYETRGELEIALLELDD